MLTPSPTLLLWLNLSFVHHCFSHLLSFPNWSSPSIEKLPCLTQSLILSNFLKIITGIFTKNKSIEGKHYIPFICVPLVHFLAQSSATSCWPVSSCLHSHRHFCVLLDHFRTMTLQIIFLCLMPPLLLGSADRCDTVEMEALRRKKKLAPLSLFPVPISNSET